MPEDKITEDLEKLKEKAISAPLVTHLYTADPSAHVFEGKFYIYPSHDIDAGIPFNDNGDHFGMEDYHVFSMEDPTAPVVDHGPALHVANVPWAERQMWAPDAAEKDGKYYLYFPAKTKTGIFKIGVAIGDHPHGPFTAQPEAIKGSYSIDPAVFADSDGSYYMYFGGIWGGQLQKYRNNIYKESHEEPSPKKPALNPIMAKLTDDLTEFCENPRPIEILDSDGNPLLAGDHNRRFFEAAWVHKHKDTYYFSYSTGNTHFICYATGNNPYGPFTYRGKILNPVIGWTSHHSICAFKERWYLFYHDSILSGGVTHLRSMKMTELHHQEDGTIDTINPYDI